MDRFFRIDLFLCKPEYFVKQEGQVDLFHKWYPMIYDIKCLAKIKPLEAWSFFPQSLLPRWFLPLKSLCPGLEALLNCPVLYPLPYSDVQMFREKKGSTPYSFRKARKNIRNRIILRGNFFDVSVSLFLCQQKNLSLLTLKLFIDLTNSHF